MDILEEVRIRSQKSEEEFNEELAILIISEVEQFILNYCNIQAVPQELRYVWIRLVLQDYNRQTERRAVNSVSEGGRTIVFGSATASSVEDFRTRQISKNTEIELNKFREVYR